MRAFVAMIKANILMNVRNRQALFFSLFMPLLMYQM